MARTDTRPWRSRIALIGCALLAGALCPASGRADEEQALRRWVLPAKGMPRDVGFWLGGGAATVGDAKPDPSVPTPAGKGAMVVRIEKSPGTEATAIQLNYVARNAVGKGGRYRVSFWLRASRPAQVVAGVLLDGPPWSDMGARGSTAIEASEEWRQHTIRFAPGLDPLGDGGIRAPHLGLGLVPAGTTLWVAGVELAETAPPPPPVPILCSEEMLRNPGFEEGLEGWSAQACRITIAPRLGAGGSSACLVTERTARWGTPSQDIRAALTANGPGFYAFGARVKAVGEAGEAFAVIHLRDAAGDRWVLTETRPLGQNGFARVSGQRFLTWTGTLHAADIGVQTVGDHTADILVDDLSLRSIADLARGRRAPGSLEVDLGSRRTFNTCVLGEAVPRIRSYAIDAWDGRRWRTAFAAGEVLGTADVVHFAPVTASRVRLRVLRADGAPSVTTLGLYGVDTRERTVRAPSVPADASRRGARTLVGAIRWDGWCGDRSSVGLGLERAMSPEKYHDRLPFYSRILGPGKVEARCIDQATMDREIAFAKEAGIDYWAFDWYPTGDGLATARQLYLSSARRSDVRWCVVLGTNPLPDADREWLIGQFREPHYQKVLGDRPLVYVFDASSSASGLVKALRDGARAARQAQPFIVFMGWGPEVARPAAECGADALGAYVNPRADRSTFAANMAHERGKWEALRATGRQIVPTVTTGWDPRPFLDTPMPWYPGATESNWVERATPEQIAEQLRTALDFVRAHPGATLANTVLIYAWNENAEGGWIVPTLFELRDAGYPVRLDAVRSVLRPSVPTGSGWGR